MDIQPEARTTTDPQEVVDLIPALRAFARTFCRDQNDADDLVQVMTRPKNAIVRQFQKFFEMEDVVLDFTDDAIDAIADKLHNVRVHVISFVITICRR